MTVDASGVWEFKPNYALPKFPSVEKWEDDKAIYPNSFPFFQVRVVE